MFFFLGFFLFNRRCCFFLDDLRFDYLGSIFLDSFLFFLLLLIFLCRRFLFKCLGLRCLRLLDNLYLFYLSRLLRGITFLFALFIALLFLLCFSGRFFSRNLFLIFLLLLLFSLGSDFFLFLGCFHGVYNFFLLLLL